MSEELLQKVCKIYEEAYNKGNLDILKSNTSYW